MNKGTKRDTSTHLPVPISVTMSCSDCAFWSSWTFLSTSASPVKERESSFPMPDEESSLAACANSPVAKARSGYNSIGLPVMKDLNGARTGSLSSDKFYGLDKAAKLRFEAIEVCPLPVKPLQPFRIGEMTTRSKV